MFMLGRRRVYSLIEDEIKDHIFLFGNAGYIAQVKTKVTQAALAKELAAPAMQRGKNPIVL